MKYTKFGSRFFESTRGRIVLLLKESAKTVNELAGTLGLTDNAVRAHLLSLERDQLVEPGGTIKGFRKPHYVYKLTEEARSHFPRAYGTLFNRLIHVLKTHLAPGALVGYLRQSGRELAEKVKDPQPSTPEERLDKCILALEELGGAAKLVVEDGRTVIRSESCPFSEAVAEHPEVCQVAEAMVAELTERHVHEICHRNGTPRCAFVIDPA